MYLNTSIRRMQRFRFPVSMYIAVLLLVLLLLHELFEILRGKLNSADHQKEQWHLEPHHSDGTQNKLCCMCCCYIFDFDWLMIRAISTLTEMALHLSHVAVIWLMLRSTLALTQTGLCCYIVGG